MLSACILAGALFLALTSSALEGDTRSAAQPASAVFTPWATATPGVVTPRATPAPPSRLLVYYIVHSQEQQTELEAAVQSDSVYRTRTDVSPSPNTSRYFLVVQNPVDAAAANELLDELAVLGPSEGYRLRVVDMR